MAEHKKKTIYIVLMRTTTILSRVVHLLTADKYTHVSIAFDESLQPLYTSSRKNGVTLFPAGPCIEWFNRGYIKNNLRNIPCAVYELKVTEEAYEKAKRDIEEILLHEDEYHFNIIGLFLCRLNIPFERKKNYFCSQLVSKILSDCEAIELPKTPSLMKPADYMELPELVCCYKGYLDGAQHRVMYDSTVGVKI